MDEVDIRSPYDGAVVGRVRLNTRADCEQAVRTAVESFAQTRQLAGYERQQILSRVANGIEARAEEFAQLMMAEAGKPIAAARAEVKRAIFTFKVAAEESVRTGGEVLPLDWQEGTRGSWSIIRRFPVGVVLAITPFNFPLNLVAHKVAPAIAVGCPVVLKPAPQTPLSALKLADLIYRSGWPREALPVLYVSNEDAQFLVEHDDIKLLSFTGSAKVGWELKTKSGKKKVVLELGGNAAVIIHADADLDLAVRRCVSGAFTYAGQSCISVQRIFVHESVRERFTAAFVDASRKLRVGDPHDDNTQVGPMIRASDVERVEQWIDEALAQGATELVGEGAGKRSREAASVLRPAILTHTTPQMKVNAEEIFAPVCSVESYRDFDDAIAAVNASQYGLQAGVFTHDARLIFRAFERIEVGGVIVNDASTFRIDHMPYGGVKDSGLGREGVRYAMEEMTEPRILVMRAP
ncbi:MAG TPA: aldehyde dehydrogenase family protein [Terriglobales bacterium]